MNEFLLAAVAQSAPPPQVSCLQQAMLPLLLFAVFYFLLIRPQQKRQRQHQEMIARLKKGDQVITNGGLIGQIVSLDDDVLVVEVADRVKVRVARPQVALYGAPAAVTEKKDK